MQTMINVSISSKEICVMHPESGEQLEFGRIYIVPKNSYWIRRLQDGSVKEVEKQIEAKKK